MWTPEIVRARFWEAAAMEKYLPSLRLPTGAGFWPRYEYEPEDREGWDDQAKQDDLLIWQGRGTAKVDALSRHQECLDWTVKYVDPKRPLTVSRVKVMWMWARSKALSRDFGPQCRRLGIARQTAYRRLHEISEQLSEQHNMIRLLLRLPAEEFLGHETNSDVSDLRSSGSCADVPQPIKFTPGYRTEKSSHLLKDEAAVADFQSHLDAVNADRRRLQEREAKRRAKIGALAS
jgi:hypothetical protein